MGSITKEYTSLLLDKVFYIALLGLGSYLIWQGDVVLRFHDSCTNFAVYSEPMIEMPTFNAFIRNLPDDLILGKDFNISVSFDLLNFFHPSKLTNGDNQIEVNGLVVNIQQIILGDMIKGSGFRIRPLNFSPEISPDHRLAFLFENSTLLAEVSIHIWPTTDNNSFMCYGKTYDGEYTADLIGIPGNF